MKILHSGPLSVAYQNGFLRRISHGDTEVIRMIYFALRDENWNTFTHQVDNENISVKDNRFTITYDSFNLDGGVSIMEWKARIDGYPDGSIVFDISGVATESLKKNRAGFCVLHPLNVIGQQCRVIHPEGPETRHTFPAEIAADNPITEIRSMEWNAGGNSYNLSFEGDIFETEDQRNWGDASFKTFCTPLRKPIPVAMKKGEKVHQRITFTPSATLNPAANPSQPIALRDAGNRRILPSLGLAASVGNRMNEKAVALIRSLRSNHYRIDLSPGSENFAVDFSNAYETAFAVGQALEVALHLTENFAEEMEAFEVISRQNKVRIKKALLLPTNGLVTSQAIIDRLHLLKSAFPQVLFGAGTNYNFNEINKNRFTATNVDFISFSMNPQEHAFDDLTTLENAASLEHLVKSAKSIYGFEMPIHISPLTLRKRSNPYATNPADLFIDDRKKADPRQKEQFTALWTFTSIVSATQGGASAMTFFQTTGEQGIVSADGEPYPVYHVLEQLTPYQGKSVTILESRDPLSICGMILDGRLLGVANLADEEKKVNWNDYAFELEPKEIRFIPLNRAQ